MNIKLIELIGPQCTAWEDGKKLYDQVLPELKARQTVNLDFTGIESVYSPFLMGGIGKLFNHFEKETIMERLMLMNISEDHLKTVNQFIDRADRQDTEQLDQESMQELFEEDELGEI